jgi:bacterioferritin (cytochrome b1)
MHGTRDARVAALFSQVNGAWRDEGEAQEIIRWLGDSDPTTRRLIEDILAEEEEHADDILDLLGG